MAAVRLKEIRDHHIRGRGALSASDRCLSHLRGFAMRTARQGRRAVLVATLCLATLPSCTQQRVEFYLGIYPHPTQLSGNHCIDSEYRQIYLEFARRHQIELIDLFPAFCELGSSIRV